MQRITAEEFDRAVRENPAWATTLTEPLEVTDLCHLYKSPITHLSPLLHFTGMGPSSADIASFVSCDGLVVVEGTFHGGVSFRGSNIEMIGSLVITNPTTTGSAASFDGCDHLKVATGIYPGRVTFKDSGIQTIRNLHATRINISGCNNLIDVPDGYLENPAVVIDPQNEMRLRSVLAKRLLARKALKPGSDLLL